VFCSLPLAAQQAQQTPATEMLNGHLVVSHRVLFAFNSAPSAATVAQIKSVTGAADTRPVGGAGAYLIDSSTLDTANLVAYLSSRRDIAYAEPDSVMTLASAPNDPQFPQQWGLDNTGQVVAGVTGTPGADVNAPGAWQTTTGSRNMVVALIDTGVQYDHPDLAANIWSAPAAFSMTVGGYVYNCPAGDHGVSTLINSVAYDPGCDPADEQTTATDGMDHGTLNAGIIGAAGNNGTGVAGVNWSVSILPLKACALEDQSRGGQEVPSCDEADVVDALQAAIDVKQQFGAQADVVAANFSFDHGYGQTLEDEMVLAGNNGITIAVATGDDCNNTSAATPASFYLANEIAVSAFDQLDQRAYWQSSYCSNAGGNVSAPGKNVLSTDTGSGYGYQQGTSAAAPFVAGAIALVSSVCPLTPKMMFADIVGAADDIPSVYSWGGGKRLDLGNAITDCTTGTPGAGQINISGSECLNCYNYPEIPSSGTITVSIGTSSYYYYWNADGGQGSAQLASALAADINSDPFRVVTAQVTSSGAASATVTITSIAKGPWTAFATDATNTDTCTPPYGGSCAPDPWNVTIAYAGGSRP
jgi:subtilisin family serine protease